MPKERILWKTFNICLWIELQTPLAELREDSFKAVTTVHIARKWVARAKGRFNVNSSFKESYEHVFYLPLPHCTQYYPLSNGIYSGHIHLFLYLTRLWNNPKMVILVVVSTFTGNIAIYTRNHLWKTAIPQQTFIYSHQFKVPNNCTWNYYYVSYLLEIVILKQMKHHLVSWIG